MMEAQFRCPSCGSLLRVRDVSAASSIGEAVEAIGAPDATWKSHTMKTLRFGDAAPSLSQVHEKFTPTREPTVAGDVRVPLAQAAITAGAITLPVALLTASQSGSPWLPLSAFGLTFTGAWLWLLADHRSLLRTVERITNRDIDGDGRVADKPVEVERRVSFNAVELSPAGRYLRSRRIEIPRGDERAVCEMAQGIIVGKAFTQREWAHLYNRDEFDTLRNTLIQHGFAVWRDNDNRKLGTDLTPPGRALFRALAEPTPPPHLEDAA